MMRAMKHGDFEELMALRTSIIISCFEYVPQMAALLVFSDQSHNLSCRTQTAGFVADIFR